MTRLLRQPFQTMTQLAAFFIILYAIDAIGFAAKGFIGKMATAVT